AVRFNTQPTTGGTQAGRLARLGDQAVGFVLASAFPAGDPAVSPREMGWVDAIAVSPPFQRRGIGAALLAWAERWLIGQGCTQFRLGGGLRPFAPGVPLALDSARFFRARGYADQPGSAHVWDVARDLRDYTSPPSVRRDLPCQVRPVEPGDAAALLAFLACEFPGRWHFECQEYLQAGGRIEDFMILVTEAGVEGFCQLTFEDSVRPLDRFFMHRLPRPWGQLGPIGVSQSYRGGGYGAVLLDGGLRRLRDHGVAGCVIDWTSLLDFYSKFGFQVYRQYEMLVKVWKQ
ncbi:MAG: GNAT family N-acetyltransferase, partial [Anaerolineae bacterium]